MEAIIRADGRQMRLTEGQEFEGGRIAGDTGDAVSYDVMMVMDGAGVQVGPPVLEGAAVTARITEHGKTRKIRFMKYKNKTRYRRTLGHRSTVTRLVGEP